MLVDLQVPFADASAAQLAWHLDGGIRPALARLSVALPGGTVDLRVLGASHQVVLDVAGERGSEVVACGLGASAGLPSRHVGALGSFDYRFEAEVLTLPAGALLERVGAVVGRVARSERGVVGRFPGSPAAITAVEVGDVAHEAGTISWRTWHAYPQTGELVVTSSLVRW